MTWFHKSSEENFHIPFQRGALSPSCMVNFIMQKVMESMCNVTVRSDDYPRDIAYKNCHNNILLVCHYIFANDQLKFTKSVVEGIQIHYCIWLL